MTESAPRPNVGCPLRPPEPCRLCQLSTTGPEDCPLVYLVMSDDELRAGLHNFLQHRRLTAA